MNDIKLIYIAGPYAGNSREETKLNIQSAQQNAKYAVRKGWMPLIPHKNTEDFEILCPDITIDFWYEGTLKLLSKCDAILLCPGWGYSKGSKNELEYARKNSIPVFYSIAELPSCKEFIEEYRSENK